MITLILAHPWHGSFNKAILDKLVEKCQIENKEYQIIDLIKDGFDPSFKEEELAEYNLGKSVDPLVDKYQKMISITTRIVFIFPIWWGTMPAVLKGFFDKVFLQNFAFSYKNGWTPLLNINKTLIITTSDNPSEMFKTAIEECFINSMLNPTGIKNGQWINCENVVKGGDEYRKLFLQKAINNI